MQKATTHYAEALWEVMKSARKSEIALIAQACVKLLEKQRMLHRGSAIFQELEEIIDREEKRAVVTVRSARDLSSEEKKKISATLKERYGVSAVELRTLVEPGLLGGLEVSWNWKKIDNTIRGRLFRIQEQITV